jgi:hypothetical protein
VVRRWSVGGQKVVTRWSERGQTVVSTLDAAIASSVYALGSDFVNILNVSDEVLQSTLWRSGTISSKAPAGS